MNYEEHINIVLIYEDHINNKLQDRINNELRRSHKQ